MLPSESLDNKILLQILSDLCPLDDFEYLNLAGLTDETLYLSYEQVALVQQRECYAISDSIESVVLAQLINKYEPTREDVIGAELTRVMLIARPRATTTCF